MHKMVSGQARLQDSFKFLQMFGPSEREQRRIHWERYREEGTERKQVALASLHESLNVRSGHAGRGPDSRPHLFPDFPNFPPFFPSRSWYVPSPCPRFTQKRAISSAKTPFVRPHEGAVARATSSALKRAFPRRFPLRTRPAAFARERWRKGWGRPRVRVGHGAKRGRKAGKKLRRVWRDKEMSVTALRRRIERTVRGANRTTRCLGSPKHECGREEREREGDRRGERRAEGKRERKG